MGPYLLATWHFINIEVRKLDASAIMRSAGLGLMPLVPMMKGANEAVMIEVMRRLKEQAPAEQSEPLSLLMAGFISRSFSLELARAIYRRFFDMSNTDVMDEMPFFQELAQKMAQKMAQPLVEEARAEERRSTLCLVLEGRFGTLAEDMLHALQSADAETLATLAIHAGTDTLEQIRARLGL